jgi:aspartate/methionine/tyrosine aminotransferase
MEREIFQQPMPGPWTSPITYSAIQGLSSLRRQIASSHDIGESMVIISNGASESISLVLACLLRPGAKVLLPRPTFPPYTALVGFHGGIPRFYDADDSSGAVLKQLAKHSDIEIVMINSPHNPTGSVLSADVVNELAQQCGSRRVWLLSDEVYSAFLYDGSEFASLAARFSPSKPQRQVVFGSMSKTMGLPAIRIGYALIAHPALYDAVIGLKLHTSIHSSTIAQDVVSSCYERITHHYVPKRSSLLSTNREMLLAALSDKKWKISTAAGGYYVMVQAPASSGDDLSLWQHFSRHGIASIPARAYGWKASAVRLSFCTRRAVIEAACHIIREMAP